MKKISRFIVLLFLVFPICSIAALGDDEELSFYELEEDLMRTVTIATGVEQSTARAPAVTSVITAADIEATGATNIDDVLQTVPGLNIARYRFFQGSVYTIRGIYSRHNTQVLMMVNGVPLTESYLGSSSDTWSGVPVAAIKRVEVIRGTGSAVYGADAFAGVINIITKNKKDIEGTETGVRLGSFDTGDAWVLHGGSYGGFDVGLALEFETTEGYDGIIEADGQTYYDKIYGTSASYAPGPMNLRKRTIETNLEVSKGHVKLQTGYHKAYDIGMGAGIALDPFGLFHYDRFNSALTYHNPKLTDNWNVTAQLTYMYTESGNHDQTTYPKGSFNGLYPNGLVYNTTVHEMHNNLNLSAFYSGFKDHLIRLGTGYSYNEISEITHSDNSTGTIFIDSTDTDNAFQPEASRDYWHVFMQDMWSFADNWELTAGLRYDKYSDFGSTLNPRGALMWQFNPKMTLKILYGSAFRAPSFAELYTNGNVWSAMNPDLDPETIKTWEIAFDYRATKKLHLTANAFNYKWRDGIIYAPEAGENIYRTNNFGVQDGHGLELEARWKMTKKTSLLMNYAFVKATNKLTNHDAGTYPKHSGYLRADHLLYPKWYLNGQINWIGEIGRVASDPREPLDGYATVDLTLHRKEMGEGHWNFTISVRNLFDTDAKAPSEGPSASGIMDVPNDLPLPGRNYWVGMRYRF